MSAPLRIIFAGTPEFAAKHLQALYESQHDVIAVYTQPDRPSGRGKKLMASEVKLLASTHNTPVFQPINLKAKATIDEFRALQADIMIVVAYGIILPKTILDAPRLGCLNVHGSLLPKWRGAAPIQRAIWAGDTETGVTIMQMDEGLDTGAMLLKRQIQINANDTSASLYLSLAELGPAALIETIDSLPSLTPQIQDGSLASYARKLSKEEAKIDWLLSASQLERNIRAFNPWPVAWCKLGNDAVKVWQAYADESSTSKAPAGTIIGAGKTAIQISTGEGLLCITRMQLPGKKPQPIADILQSKATLLTVGNTLS